MEKTRAAYAPIASLALPNGIAFIAKTEPGKCGYKSSVIISRDGNWQRYSLNIHSRHEPAQPGSCHEQIFFISVSYRPFGQKRGKCRRYARLAGLNLRRGRSQFAAQAPAADEAMRHEPMKAIFKYCQPN